MRICPVCETETSRSHCPHDGEATVPAPEEWTLEPGTLVADRFSIEGVLGQGGYGTVYRASQLSIGRTVALKVLHHQGDAKSIQRFFREAKAASQLGHPNIVRVFDYGFDEHLKAYFLVMELVEGRTLKSLLLQEGPLPQKRAAALLAEVTRALLEAHQKDIIHRDLKPDNVMVTAHLDGTEHIKVLDFGVAKMLGPKAERSLTCTGGPIGTPLYMSPEQVKTAPVDARSDLYSLGCILHEVLTGAPPYNAERAIAVMYQHLHDPAPMLADELPCGEYPQEALLLLHEMLLSKQPEDRPSSTQSVLHVLQAIATGVDPELSPLYRRDTPSSPSPSTNVGLEDTLPSAGVPAGPSTRTSAPRPAPHPRSAPRALWGVALFAVLGGAFAFTSQQRPARSKLPNPVPSVPEPKPVALKTAKIWLRLNSHPQGAQVLIDGQAHGETPQRIALKSSTSTKTITFVKPGYLALEQRVIPKTSHSIVVALQPMPKISKGRKTTKPRLTRKADTPQIQALPALKLKR